jgi:hypothetical protein
MNSRTHTASSPGAGSWRGHRWSGLDLQNADRAHYAEGMDDSGSKNPSVPRTRNASAMMTMPSVVIAYHGTSGQNVERILREGFVASVNRYDWLGDGSYFFQEVPGFPHTALEHAWAWADKQYAGDQAVICAKIDLLDCMDLLSLGWSSRLRLLHDELSDRARSIGMQLPKQAGGNHGLDRMLINYAAGVLADQGQPVRSVRGCFGEDARAAFPGSSLFDLTHVQIAVRDAGVISAPERVLGPPKAPVS